jgi:hypothetical protein
VPLSPLPPPRPPSLLDRLLDRFSRRLSWRVRCNRCAWVEDAGSEGEAAELLEIHRRDHKRKDIAAEIRIYPLTLWRRYSDHVDDSV